MSHYMSGCTKPVSNAVSYTLQTRKEKEKRHKVKLKDS